MTLKELYEDHRNITNAIIHRYLDKPAQYRAKYSFEDYLEELAVCPKCGDVYEHQEMYLYNDELICEECRKLEG